jgi:hypothetical protein
MKSIDVTAYIMGIAHPKRLEWLKITVDYMDQQMFPFKNKIISIDQFNGYTVPLEVTKYFEKSGWTVLLDSHKSRIASMDRAFSIIDTEYMFYNEDDVMAKMPDINDLTKVFEKEIGGRKCGMISMTLGGTQYDAKSGNIGDLKHMMENVIIKSDEYVIFRRLEEFKNAWFFEFPGLWIKTDLFKNCHNKSKGLGGQIEQSLTRTYINNGYINNYYKCSIAKTNALDTLLLDGSKVNTHCRLLTNLDPSQGNSPLGGNHFY